MRLSALAKTMLMGKISSGTAVRMGETNVYAILGSTKKGQTEFAKMAIPKETGNLNIDPSIPMKKTVSLPADGYFQEGMTCDEVGKYFADTFDDFSIDRYNEIIEYLKFEKNVTVGEMSGVSVQKLKVAATLARNSRVYMLDNPFLGMNPTARDQILRVIFSWQAACSTIALLVYNTDEVNAVVSCCEQHEGDLPVISISYGKSVSESFA